MTVALAAVAALLGVRRMPPQQPPRYQTETVTRGRVTGVLQVPAWLEPTATVRVAAEAPARVAAVAVTVGERVRRGQILARLDARALKAEAVGAEAQAMAAHVAVRQAETRLGQIVFVLERLGQAPPNSPHREHVPELEAAAVEAEAELMRNAADLQRYASMVASRRAQISSTVLRAPIDGVVVKRAIEPGEMAVPGAPLIVVASPASELRVVAQVGEKDVDRIRPGPATFTVPSLPESTFEALIVAVEPGPQGERPPFSYRVRLLARNTGTLRAGMTAQVALPVESGGDALQVPVDALRFQPEVLTPRGAAVHVLDDGGRPIRIPVEVGVTDGASVEIRGSLLAPGAQVVVATGPS